MMRRILILGGTGQARLLADSLVKAGFDVVSSLAGRTDNPILPDGKTRIGGFGGVEGLAAYLVDENISFLIDATHPFAARISTNATTAAQEAGVTVIRLERPPWKAEEGDQWHYVQTLDEAVSVLPEDCTALVTIGRQQLGRFLDRPDVTIIARAIEQPAIPIPDDWTIILERPPFTLDDELVLFEKYQIDVLVTKNAGGNETRGKLVAARHLQKPVIIINRLQKPPVPLFETEAAVIAYLKLQV